MAHRDLVGRPDVKRPLGRPRHIWEDDIKLDISGIRWRGMGSGSGESRWLTFVNAIMNIRVSLNARNFLISSGTASLS